MNTRSTSGLVRSSFASLLLLALLTGCGEGDAQPAATAPPVIAPPPPAVIVSTPPCNAIPPPAQCTTVAGEVFSATGAFTAFEVAVLVEPDDGWWPGKPYWTLYGGSSSGQAGHFVTLPLPPATLTLSPFAEPDYSFQPCAAIIRSPSTSVTRIQLFAPAEFDTADAPRPVNATEPSLAGTIFEMTPEGRKPVSGASIQAGNSNLGLYWWVENPAIASARSSLEGRFYLCRLPPGIQLYVSKPGFVDAFVLPGTVTPGAPFDIELRRSGT